MDSLKWLSFDLLLNCPRLVHGVFLRHGGFSEGAFSSLNFGLSQGDDPNVVALNRKRAQEALGIEKIALLHQHHSNSIIEAAPDQQEWGDALTTQLPGLGLLILHADCQAALIYDPVEHALAAVHCGWRGSVKNIYKETVEWMKGRYGSKPENLLVGISPSLGPESAEFRSYQKELPESFWSFQCKPTYFDFWAISRWQLQACGVLSHHIEITGLCTLSNPQDFFSYRRCQKSGRHGTLATLL
jgi:YfiH family protein